MRQIPKRRRPKMLDPDDIETLDTQLDALEAGL